MHFLGAFQINILIFKLCSCCLTIIYKYPLNTKPYQYLYPLKLIHSTPLVKKEMKITFGYRLTSFVRYFPVKCVPRQPLSISSAVQGRQCNYRKKIRFERKSVKAVKHGTYCSSFKGVHLWQNFPLKFRIYHHYCIQMMSQRMACF